MFQLQFSVAKNVLSRHGSRNKLLFLQRPLFSYRNYTGGRTNIDGIPKTDNVKNEKLLKIILKSKTITKMYNNPKYNHFFADLLQSSTTTILGTFFILHELTAVVPLFLLWYLAYENWDKIDTYYEKLLAQYSLKDDFAAGENSSSQNRPLEKDTTDRNDDHDRNDVTDSNFKTYIEEKGREKLNHFYMVFSRMSEKYFSKRGKEISDGTFEPSDDYDVSDELERLRKLTISGVASYTVVKVLAPFRMMASIYFTPQLAKFLQNHVFASIKKILKRV